MTRWLIVLLAVVDPGRPGGLVHFLVSRLQCYRRFAWGILHSQTGPMEISEQSMIDAELLAIEEINARAASWAAGSSRSLPTDSPTGRPSPGKPQRLIEREKVSVIFGCWTSASRKSVKPVVEQNAHLLIYPMAYEGLEQSPNIVYTGARPTSR